jgi:hypothetical protein
MKVYNRGTVGGKFLIKDEYVELGPNNFVERELTQEEAQNLPLPLKAEGKFSKPVEITKSVETKEKAK